MVSRASARNDKNFAGQRPQQFWGVRGLAVSRLRGRAEPATIFFERRCKAFWKFEESFLETLYMYSVIKHLDYNETTAILFGLEELV